MRNHKVVFRLYGIRRPLKWRRRMARQNRRLADQLGKKWRACRGSHSRWWEQGLIESMFEGVRFD